MAEKPSGKPDNPYLLQRLKAVFESQRHSPENQHLAVCIDNVRYMLYRPLAAAPGAYALSYKDESAALQYTAFFDHQLNLVTLFKATTVGEIRAQRVYVDAEKEASLLMMLDRMVEEERLKIQQHMLPQSEVQENPISAIDQMTEAALARVQNTTKVPPSSEWN